MSKRKASSDLENKEKKKKLEDVPLLKPCISQPEYKSLIKLDEKSKDFFPLSYIKRRIPDSKWEYVINFLYTECQDCDRMSHDLVDGKCDTCINPPLLADYITSLKYIHLIKQKTYPLLHISSKIPNVIWEYIIKFLYSKCRYCFTISQYPLIKGRCDICLKCPICKSYYTIPTSAKDFQVDFLLQLLKYKCVSCERDVCGDCSKSCSLCGEDICDECIEQCESCGEEFCDDCNDVCHSCGEDKDICPFNDCYH